MNMFKKNGGFTLVELIVVIAILAILAAVAVPAYNGYIGKAQEASDITALASVKTAAMGACATEGTVTKVEVTIVDGGNTVDITCVSGATTKVFKLKYSSDAWVYAATGDANAVAGEADVIKDFNTFINKADIQIQTGKKAVWDNTDTNTADTKGEWVISAS